MKLCFFIGNMNRSGGTERVLSQITTGLIQKGYDIDILNMYGSSKEKSFYTFDPAIKKIWLAPEYPSTISGHCHQVVSLHQYLKKERHVVLIEVDLILSLYTTLARIGTDVYVISWEHFNYYYQFRKHNKIRRIAMVTAALFSQKLIVLTKEDKRYYKRHLPVKNKIVQIYNPNSFEISEGQLSMESHRREKMVLAAGRLTTAKGFSYLIQAWKDLEAEFLDWRLVITGEGELREELEDLVMQYGLKRVFLPGNSDKMEEYYETASLFVLPSLHEGFGMVITEAMQYGVPVVSFACKAGPRDIIRHKKNGFLVRTGDVAGLKKYMKMLMSEESLRKTIGENGKRSCERFRLEKIIAQWDHLFQGIREEKNL